jgi:hypothetical protein
LKICSNLDRKSLIEQKKKYELAIAWLTKIDELHLSVAKDYLFRELPETSTTFSEYIVVDTCASEESRDWKQLFREDDKVWLYTGDIIINFSLKKIDKVE